MKAAEVESAPKRGQYDRALSRRDRQDAQRDRIFSALGALSADQLELSIANVVEIAGIGRNTFYEYFDGIEQALNAITSRALSELVTRTESNLKVARTPLERIRALARAWTESLLVNPQLVALVLRPGSKKVSAAQHSALAEYIADLLSRDLTARSALPGLGDPLRVSAVAAIFDTLSRECALGDKATGDKLQALLSELSLRLLR
jgi:AcrR family transcriptional regulator